MALDYEPELERIATSGGQLQENSGQALNYWCVGPALRNTGVPIQPTRQHDISSTANPTTRFDLNFLGTCWTPNKLVATRGAGAGR